jgi:hypothetical protein
METKEVYKGITAVTRALGRAGISKDRKNAQQGYNFRGIDDIYNALSSELATAQLCIIPRVVSRESVERQGRSGGALFYVTIHAEYDIVSAIDGSSHTASAYGEAMDSGDKATNKAMSAAYKYMAMQLFCIPTEGDNDADASTHEVQARGAAYDRPQRQPAPANGNAPVCDGCGAVGRLGKDGKSYYCPEKDKHGGKWYTIKARSDSAEWDAIEASER